MEERRPNLGKEVLYQTEEALAQRFPCGATPADTAIQYLGLPQERIGLIIVDVAAGLSSLTPTLLAEGANVYAVDSVYGATREELEGLIDETRTKTLASTPPGYFQEMDRLVREASGQFEVSYVACPDRYIKGYATRLPFPDNFADYAISMNGISGFIREPDVLIEAIKEALRIVKPGGKVVLAPWFSGDDWMDEVVEIHSRVLREILLDPQVSALVEIDLPLRASVDLGRGTRVTFTKLFSMAAQNPEYAKAA